MNRTEFPKAWQNTKLLKKLEIISRVVIFLRRENFEIRNQSGVLSPTISSDCCTAISIYCYFYPFFLIDLSTLLSGSSFEVPQYFQFFLRCCWEYFQFAQILLTNGSWICPKVHQCNGSKGKLLIWKNGIFWIKFADSWQRWNWTYLKFLLQPETIYLSAVNNFQHLPTSNGKKRPCFYQETKIVVFTGRLTNCDRKKKQIVGHYWPRNGQSRFVWNKSI